jgi:hypothetical protein
VNIASVGVDAVEPGLLNQLPTDRTAIIAKIAADLDMEPAEVLAWAVDLLTRYVAAGGEP